MRAEVYWTLHRDTYSVRRWRGKVAYWPAMVTLLAGTFHVSAAGRARVLREQRKNVHAFVRGEVAPQQHLAPPAGAVRVSYNPYRGGSFYRCDTGEPVTQHDGCVLLSEQGKARVYAVNPR